MQEQLIPVSFRLYFFAIESSLDTTWTIFNKIREKSFLGIVNWEIFAAVLFSLISRSALFWENKLPRNIHSKCTFKDIYTQNAKLIQHEFILRLQITK